MTTWLTIYFAATRIFKLEPKFGAVLGAAGAVCGVSAAIAVGGAVKAKKEHISITIAVVTVWAIVMIFFPHHPPQATRSEYPLPGRGGAWVGNSEFADAAGLAVVAELATRFGDAPINAFTLMKVIGRDIWIGIWCLIPLRGVGDFLGQGRGRKSRSRQRRDHLGALPQVRPRISGRLSDHELRLRPTPPDGRPRAPGRVVSRALSYQADFAAFTVPTALADRFTVEAQGKTLSFKGPLSREDYKALAQSATPRPGPEPWTALRARTNWFESVLTPQVVGPVKKLRSWAFVLCFRASASPPGSETWQPSG